MLRTIGLIILGLLAIGILSADLEILGFEEHPYVARIVAAACVGLVAYSYRFFSDVRNRHS